MDFAELEYISRLRSGVKGHFSYRRVAWEMKQALEKLHRMVNKIGYPDKWRDYSSVRIVRDDFLGNVTRATES